MSPIEGRKWLDNNHYELKCKCAINLKHPGSNEVWQYDSMCLEAFKALGVLIDHE